MESQIRPDDGKPIDSLPLIAKIPQDAAGFSAYSVVMLGDISPNMLPEKYQEELAKAVEENGVGLIVQAGTQHMPMAYLNGPAGPGPAREAHDEEARQAAGPHKLHGRRGRPFAPFHMSVTANGSIHPAFRLYDSATQNRAMWSQMTEFYWASPVKVTDPAVTTLATIATATGDRPLIVERYSGRGRVLFVGIDSTYRWRRNIGPPAFLSVLGPGPAPRLQDRVALVGRELDHRHARPDRAGRTRGRRTLCGGWVGPADRRLQGRHRHPPGRRRRVPDAGPNQ